MIRSGGKSVTAVVRHYYKYQSLMMTAESRKTKHSEMVT